MTMSSSKTASRVKYMDCVGLPVDCFYEGENMLVIHPMNDRRVCDPVSGRGLGPDTESGLEWQA
jgi:hypothetical protein